MHKSSQIYQCTAEMLTSHVAAPRACALACSTLLIHAAQGAAQENAVRASPGHRLARHPPLVQCGGKHRAQFERGPPASLGGRRAWPLLPSALAASSRRENRNNVAYATPLSQVTCCVGLWTILFVDRVSAYDAGTSACARRNARGGCRPHRPRGYGGTCW